jgi:hypothetical protein
MTMKATMLLACVLGIATSARAAGDRPRVLRASIQEGGHKVAGRLGNYGGWLVRSAERWEETLKMLAAAGVKVEDDLGPVDWVKEDLACVFHYGDEGDQFVVRYVGGDEKRRDVEIGMSYIIYKQRRALPMGVWRAFAVPVPKAAATRVSVSTFHPMNGGDHPTIDKARPEWEWTFSETAGDAVGGVTGVIEPKALTVNAGEDVAVKFSLTGDGAAKVKDGQFARAAAAAYVWDGKYSNGYRNHAFEVVTPAGKLLVLRPKVQNDWDKNAPHAVAIKAGETYVLPDWGDPTPFKSLKALGLDTTAAGVYVITGVYEQRPSPMPRGGTEDMWGGVVRTNAVRVEVK